MNTSVSQSHYDYIESVSQQFSSELGLDPSIAMTATFHGDKCYQYKEQWEEEGIPFAKGALVYLLTFYSRWSSTVRETSNGWVPPLKWVIDQCTKSGEIKTALDKLPNPQ